jgi:hypothetical protein
LFVPLDMIRRVKYHFLTSVYLEQSTVAILVPWSHGERI